MSAERWRRNPPTVAAATTAAIDRAISA